MTDISPLSPSVLLADDEPLLLEALEDELKSLWPEVSDPEYYPLPLFVFVTAFTEHAIEAFELAAVDYVVKPVTAKRMVDTVERLNLQMARSGWNSITQSGDPS